MQHAAAQVFWFRGPRRGGGDDQAADSPPGTRDWIFKLIAFYESSHSTATEVGPRSKKVFKVLSVHLIVKYAFWSGGHGLQLEGRLSVSQWLFEMEISELNVHPAAFNVPHTHDGMIICRNLHWFSLMCPTIHDTMNHCIQVNDYLIDQSLTSTDDMRQFSGHY